MDNRKIRDIITIKTMVLCDFNSYNVHDDSQLYVTSIIRWGPLEQHFRGVGQYE